MSLFKYVGELEAVLLDVLRHDGGTSVDVKPGEVVDLKEGSHPALVPVDAPVVAEAPVVTVTEPVSAEPTDAPEGN